MGSRIWQWLNERWPFSTLLRLALDEEIPGGARFAYAEGSVILILFILQAVTGIMQLFFYVPTIDHAYDSLSFLRTEVPFGWLIHGLHYWGANLMVVAVAVHMARVFVWGAYKRPRELTWLAGVSLLLVTMALSFTGTPLSWDQEGYWEGEVGTSIAATAPLIGDFIKRLLRGGEEMGQLALSRFFVMHTSVFPLMLVALFGFHIIAFRKFGSAGPWNESERRHSGPFWPDQAFKDVVAGTGVFLLLIILTVLAPPEFAGPADVLDTSYVPKPEWNFLFLYEALKYFHGPLEPVGTVGVPTVLVLLLVLLPFIDRNPETNPFRRPVAMLCGLLFTGLLIALTVSGYYSPGFAQTPVSEGSTAPPQPAPSPAVASAQGGKQGPGSTTWDTGPAAGIIGSAERGASLFSMYCASCHGQHGKGGVPNPGSTRGSIPALDPIDRRVYNENARVFAGNIDPFIQHGSRPAGSRFSISMPSFGDNNTLTQQEIANLEAYILRVNGVDRAQLINPGMQPRNFLILVVAVYALLVLVQGGLRVRGKIS